MQRENLGCSIVSGRSQHPWEVLDLTWMFSIVLSWSVAQSPCHPTWTSWPLEGDVAWGGAKSLQMEVVLKRKTTEGCSVSRSWGKGESNLLVWGKII